MQRLAVEHKIPTCFISFSALANYARTERYTKLEAQCQKYTITSIDSRKQVKNFNRMAIGPRPKLN